MLRTRVKICCIASVEEARLAVRLGADALGLVGPMPSGPGVIDLDDAATIAASVPPPVATFLLSSETEAEAIAAQVERVRPSTVQVVQHLEPAQARALRSHLPRTRIVQVIHVEDAGALGLMDTYAGTCDAFLLDSGRPSASTQVLGGTGLTHDWSISRAFVQRSPLPVFLAGGLRPDNVAQAIEQVAPFGLDLCSGVRTDGALDPDKLAAFMAARRGADAGA